MRDWSRRDALHALAGAGGLALAGCSGEAGHTVEVPGERKERISDPTVMFVRDSVGGILFTVDDYSNGTATPTPGEFEFLSNADERDELAFADSAAADELAAFVDETDFETESIYLIERSLGECYELALTGVYREPDGVEVDFCRLLRPADVACAADVEDTVGVAIRLPFTGEGFDSYGMGMSGGCDQPIIAREDGARS